MRSFIIFGCLSVAGLLTSVQADAQQVASESVTTSTEHSLHSQRTADRALVKAVRRILAKDRDIDTSRMSFRAKSGTVTVAGTVPPGTDIEKVTREIEAVPNVTAVVNKLRVRAGTTTQ